MNYDDDDNGEDDDDDDEDDDDHHGWPIIREHSASGREW